MFDRGLNLTMQAVRRQLANAVVQRVGDEDRAGRIDCHAGRLVEAGRVRLAIGEATILARLLGAPTIYSARLPGQQSQLPDSYGQMPDQLEV